MKVKGWIDWTNGHGTLQGGGARLSGADVRAAIDRDFKPVSLGGSASFSIAATSRQVQSRNVVARLEGSDPALKDEYVIFTAHWDHLGKDPTREGRSDLQRCGRQRVRHGRRARDRPGVHQGAAGPEAVAAVPLRHGRGERTAGLEVLRQRVRSIRCRRRWPTSIST